MTFEVVVGRRAAAYLERLEPAMQARVVAALRELAVDPYGAQSKALRDPEGRRSRRVGGLRIIYRVNRTTQTVEVSAIGPRGQVYRDL